MNISSTELFSDLKKKKRWEDNITDWTGLDFNSSQRAAEDRQRWQKIVADVNSGAPTTLMVPGHGKYNLTIIKLHFLFLVENVKIKLNV